MLVRQYLHLEYQALFIHLYRVVIVALDLCYDRYVSAYLSYHKVINGGYLVIVWCSPDFVD